MQTRLSKSYYAALERTRRHHAAKQGKTFSGRFTWKQRHRLKGIIEEFDVHSILDYGCGWGKQYEERDPDTGQSLAEFWGIDPVKYDPGVAHFAAEPPGVFDMVICIQVLGSIPRGALPVIIDRLYSHASKVLVVAERIGQPHKKIFEDMAAEMPHNISAEEWMQMLRRPGSPVALVALFHNQDEKTGWPGWRREMPADQGPT